jgi:peroxiredoxin
VGTVFREARLSGRVRKLGYVLEGGLRAAFLLKVAATFEMQMTRIKVGDKMPEGKFTRMTQDGPQKITTDELFKGKTVVLFSVPGAFTPTCDAKHLPGFVEHGRHQIKAKGVDTIACTAVNDVFVMNAWGKPPASPIRF